MISRLKGMHVDTDGSWIVMDVEGVGYEVEVTRRTLEQLAVRDPLQPLLLYTHLAIREDAHALYGFPEKAERDLFRLLIKVNGVGPKLALTLLSGTTIQGFVKSVEEGDTQKLVKLPGVGKKTAERLIIEMRDKLPDWFGRVAETKDLDWLVGTKPDSSSPAAIDHRSEAEEALIALGYKPQQASQLIGKVAEKDMTTQEIVRLALKAMVKN